MIDLRIEPLGEMRVYTETEKAIFHLSENFERLIDIIEQQEQRIERLQDTLFEIAPELDVISVIADSEEERQRLISKYLNRDENYMSGTEDGIMIGGTMKGHRSQNDSLMDGMKGRADGGADFRNDNSDGSKTDSSEYGCVKYSDRRKTK